MRFSARERTGLQAMVEFARRYGEGPVPLGDVAIAQDLPLPYLAHVVGELRRAGLLASVRGVHGGYRLTREPAQISVAQVLRAIEGALISLDCTRSDGTFCSREDVCATRSVMQVLVERVSDTLDGTSLADVLP